MHRSLCLAVLLLVGAFALNDRRTILLRGGHIDTTKVPSLSAVDNDNTDHLLTTTHSALWKAAVPARSAYLVHVDRAHFDRSEVEAVLGVELSQYLPHNTFMVYAPHDLVKSLPQQVKGVLWTAHLPSQNKVDPNSRALLSNPTVAITSSQLPTAVSLVVSSFTEVDFDALEASIQRQFALDTLGFELSIESIKESRFAVTVALADPSADAVEMHAVANEMLSFLADHAEVKWVEMKRKIEMKNKYARVVTQTGASDVTGDEFTTALYTGDITGEGVIIGVGDTGVDATHCSFFDDAVATPFDTTNTEHRKIVHYETYVDNGDYEGGHGSHVSGSVLGHPEDDSDLDAYVHSGMAPEAKLWFFDIGDSYGGLDVPDNLYKNYFKKAWKDNVHLHSNSWGCSGPQYGAPDFCNTYDSECEDVDDFIYDYPDFLILIAAGNDGTTTRYGSVGSPAVSKNSLTVGASSNSYWAWVEYGTDGYDNDGISSFLDQDVMASFSSTGPTYDGRIKPDIVAPGHEIMSVNSDGSTSTSSITCGVHTMSGTSMATPVTAGSIGLVQQYFQDGFYPTGVSVMNNAFYPTAALLKALVINGATPMSGVQRLWADPILLPSTDEDAVYEGDLDTTTASGETWSTLTEGVTAQLYVIGTPNHYFKFTPTDSSAYVKIWMQVPYGDVDLYADTASSFINSALYLAEEMSATYGDEHIVFSNPGVGVPIYIVVEQWSSFSAASLRAEMSNSYYVTAPTLDCSDTYLDAVTSVVRCPTNCAANDVWGTRWYSVDSSLCAAAKHQGVITSSAPFDEDYQYVAVHLIGIPSVTGVLENLFNWTTVASDRNGVESDSKLVFDFVMTFEISGSGINDVDYDGFETDVPNPSSGFGRVNLLNTFSLPSQSPDRYTTILSNRYDDSVDDGESISYTVDNSAITGMLKFTLAWSDPAASPNAAIALVNNLDLMVTTSDCDNSGDNDAEFYGNGGTSSDMDMLNNVEQVVILSPRVCTYTVMVMGTDVPKGPQDFAVVAGGYDFVQTGDVDVFEETGEDVTGWGGPPVDRSAAASVRPVAAIVALFAAAVALLL